MQPSARSTLISLVEEHVTGLVRDAIAVQRHSKRARLHPPPTPPTPTTSTGNTRQVAWEDESYRPQQHHHHQQQQHVLAVTPEGFVVKSRLHAADINMALQLRGSEKLYATGVVPVAVGGGHGAAANKDWQQPVQLKDFLRQEAEHMPVAPSEMTLRMHWLAVDGLQPEIPENPLPHSTTTSIMTTTTPDGAFPGLASTILPMSMTTLSSTTTTLTTSGSIPDPTGSSIGSTGLLVHQLQAAMLSEELQLYFTRVCMAMERGSATVVTAQQQDAVLQSLQRDAGLQELVPFLVRYAIQELCQLLAGRMTEHARTMIRMITALLHNPQLHLELHLQALVPALITAVVAKQLGKPSSKQQQQQSKITNKSSKALLSGAAAGPPANSAAAVATTDSSQATTSAVTVNSINNNNHNNNNSSNNKEATTTATTTVTNNPKTDATKTTVNQNKGRKDKRTAAFGDTNSNHWALRREAAVALVRICHLFGAQYPTLKARILRTFVGALSQSSSSLQQQQRSLASRYGALVAITLFGPKAVDAFLLPTALFAWQEWEDQLTRRYRRSKHQKKIQQEQQQQQQRNAAVLQSPSAAAAPTVTSNEGMSTGTTDVAADGAEAMDEDKPTESATVTATTTPSTKKERDSTADATMDDPDSSNNNNNNNNSNHHPDADDEDGDEHDEDDDAETQHATRMCQQAALHALGIFLQRVSYSEQAARLNNSSSNNSNNNSKNGGWDDLESALGDRLVALHGAPTDYAMCFV